MSKGTAMEKVLPGSSRAAFDFISTHWHGLLRVSFLPMFVILIASWFQLRGLGSMLEFMALEAKLGDQMDSVMMVQFFEKMSPTYVIGLLSILAFVWNFVRIVRFWKTGEGQLFGLTQGELGATFLTAVYGFGMLLLTMAVYVGGIIGLVLLGGLGAMLLSGTILAAAGAVVLEILGLAGFLALLLFIYRFLVGLPGIALGETPGFFSDIWPLAKGESWGLPLRLMFWTIVAAIPIVIVSLIFTVPLMTEIQTQLQSQEKPEMSPEMISQMMKTMVPMQFINLVLQAPVIWFCTILMTEAHFRFRKKLSG
jgi:hypothetical protein